jgi:hypothetical protein
VVNPTQARQLLAAVREIYPSLEAYYGCMYYAALRPAEVRHLTEAHLKLPDDGWGELLLVGSTQQTGQSGAIQARPARTGRSSTGRLGVLVSSLPAPSWSR